MRTSVFHFTLPPSTRCVTMTMMLALSCHTIRHISLVEAALGPARCSQTTQILWYKTWLGYARKIYLSGRIPLLQTPSSPLPTGRMTLGCKLLMKIFCVWGLNTVHSGGSSWKLQYYPLKICPKTDTIQSLLWYPLKLFCHCLRHLI